jgi:hypothetical protein
MIIALKRFLSTLLIPGTQYLIIPIYGGMAAPFKKEVDKKTSKSKIFNQTCIYRPQDINAAFQ